MKFLFPGFIVFMLIMSSVRMAASDLPTSGDTLKPAIDNLLGKSARIAFNRYKSSPAYKSDTLNIGKCLRQARKLQGMNNDSLTLLSSRAVGLSLDNNNAELVSESLQVLARSFMFKEDYTSAGNCYLQCLRIEDFLGNEKRVADLNAELGLIYYYQEIFAKSLQYFEKALQVYLRNKDTLDIARTYSYIGNLHSSREFCETRNKEEKQHDFNLAISYLEKTVALCRQNHFESLQMSVYVSLASVYNKLDQPEKALPYLREAIEYLRENKNYSRLVGTLHTLGKTYFKLKDYKQSVSCFKESQEIAEKHHLTDGIQYLFEALAQTYEAAGDYKNAYWTYIRYMTIRDSLVTAEKAKALFELETKYQTEKKEKEIFRLNADKREKNQLLLALSTFIVFLLLLVYFIVKNARGRKTIVEQTLKIQEQQIRDLEKERQLIATRSVLQGEEAERSRMARDLHDGLGGILSSIKINLSSMKGNAIITEENAEAFSHALSLLDHSITELRRVAHNIMPETLVHYGLNAAFSEFVNRIATDRIPQIDYQFFGEETRYSSDLEITLYRIGQELINNALKHSKSETINIQLFAEKSRLCLQVTDNGNGFDPGLPASGKGLSNIRDRASALGGHFELWSQPGKGTEATVEFLLP